MLLITLAHNKLAQNHCLVSTNCQNIKLYSLHPVARVTEQKSLLTDVVKTTFWENFNASMKKISFNKVVCSRRTEVQDLLFLSLPTEAAGLKTLF